MTRAGIVTLAGRPNAGKSTLLNRLVGQKLSITSAKPQSTRDRIVGIRTDADSQLVLLDTPGLLDPAYALQRAMRATALAALADADVVVYLADGRAGAPSSLEVAAALDTPVRAPVITAVNKADAIGGTEQERILAASPGAIPISALTGAGIDALVQRIGALLPEAPFLYPGNDVATQSLRFFTAELVRETALEQLGDELPYSLAIEVEEFRENRSPVYIRAVLYVERESQRRILIGERGSRIRALGAAARHKIERLVGSGVYLDLWVKVLQNWRRDAAALRRFGYDLPPGK